MHTAVKLQVQIPKEGAGARRVPARRVSAPALTKRMDYFARLTSHQPHPLSAEASHALDEADRGER